MNMNTYFVQLYSDLQATIINLVIKTRTPEMATAKALEACENYIDDSFEVQVTPVKFVNGIFIPPS